MRSPTKNCIKFKGTHINFNRPIIRECLKDSVKVSVSITSQKIIRDFGKKEKRKIKEKRKCGRTYVRVERLKVRGWLVCGEEKFVCEILMNGAHLPCFFFFSWISMPLFQSPMRPSLQVLHLLPFPSSITISSFLLCQASINQLIHSFIYNHHNHCPCFPNMHWFNCCLPYGTRNYSMTIHTPKNQDMWLFNSAISYKKPLFWIKK